jgi:hypothetical protein
METISHTHTVQVPGASVLTASVDPPVSASGNHRHHHHSIESAAGGSASAPVLPLPNLTAKPSNRPTTLTIQAGTAAPAAGLSIVPINPQSVNNNVQTVTVTVALTTETFVSISTIVSTLTVTA